MGCVRVGLFFFFKQKTAYEMRISDWSSDVCSSDLVAAREGRAYEPVTAVGQHNAGVVERAGLRQYIERGTEWLRDMGQRIAGRLHDVAASLSGAVERDRREAAEVQLAREAQERLAADRARQEAQ